MPPLVAHARLQLAVVIDTQDAYATKLRYGRAAVMVYGMVTLAAEIQSTTIARNDTGEACEHSTACAIKSDRWYAGQLMKSYPVVRPGIQKG